MAEQGPTNEPGTAAAAASPASPTRADPPPVAWEEVRRELAVLAAAERGTAWVEPRAAVGRDDRLWLGRWFMVLIAGGLVAFLWWASRTRLEQVVRAQGKVIPSTLTQVIQSLEGGIVRELPVKEGQTVRAGDVLVKFNEVQFEAQYRENLTKRQALRVRLVRLRAEAEGAAAPEFPQDLRRESPGNVETELLLFAKRHADLEANHKALRDKIEFKRRQFELLKGLFDDGTMAETRRLELEMEIADAEGRLAVLTTGFVRQAMEDYDREREKLQAIEESIRADEDRFRRTTLVSPVDGVVNKIFIDSAGRVVHGGQPIMEVVPANEPVVVEARIRPQDIAFTKVGQPVRLRFTAYDFTTYGGMDGQVETLGVDTVNGAGAGPGPNNEVYYPVRIRTAAASLGRDRLTGEELILRPGMVAEVDILSGERTLLEYLLKPVQRARRLALRER